MITNDHQSSIIPGYFEMDCALTGLRGGDRRVDEAVLALANFPVGNAGEPGTPHEFLVADTVPLPDPLACSDSSSSRSKNKNNVFFFSYANDCEYDYDYDYYYYLAT